MKKIIVAIAAVVLCGISLGAQNVVVPEGYELVDSLVYRPVSGADSSLVGKSVWSVMPLRSRGDAADVTVSQSVKLRNAIDRQISTNSSRSISGYRVRIFFDNGQTSRSESEAVLKRFEAMYHGVPAYRTYTNPYFKVTVGDFRTRSEAMALLVKLRNEFPRALMVKEKINYPAADASCTYVVDTLQILRPIGQF